MCLDVCLIYFISAAVIILVASIVTMILFPLPYNTFYSGSLLSPFLNIVIKTTFFLSLRIHIIYMLFKIYINLSLKCSGTYLFNSELMLFSPGLLPFFVNFKTFPNSDVVYGKR